MKRWLITGGAGFIGANAVARLVSDNDSVVILDDLSRSGSAANLDYLKARYEFTYVGLSLQDTSALNAWAVTQEPFDIVLHLAAQVSLMQSIADPMTDFLSNALGTLNLLEVQRLAWPEAIFIFASTNKVYGDLAHVEIIEERTRFSAPRHQNGFDESLPLDFHGGYSCSKGVADQYVLDYNRIFGLKTVVLRQSAVCGRFQNPRADQGWASFLVRETLAGRQVQLNGVGKQVRDLLDVDDLVDLYVKVSQASVFGQCYNIGGGPGRDLSLLELFKELDDRGFTSDFRTGAYRPSDQRVFIADIRKAKESFGWSPRISKSEIIDRLIREEGRSFRERS